MSTRSVLTVVGAVVGAVVGFYTGNVVLGFQIGTAIGGLVGNAVDPVKLYGPRLGDGKLASYRDGVPIPWGIGRFRITGPTCMACQPGPPTETEVEEQQDKGGGPVNVTYRQSRTHAVMACEGEILGFLRIWRSGKLVYDVSEQPTEANTGVSGDTLAAYVQAWIAARAQATSFAANIRLYTGSETQMPDSELEALFGAGNVPAHRGIAYMVVVNDDVTRLEGALPVYEFEVVVAGSTEPFVTVGGNSQWVTAISSAEAIFTNNDATMEAAVGTLTYDAARTAAGRSAGKLYFETEEFTVGGGVVSGVCTAGVDTTLGTSPDAAAGGDTWALATNGFDFSNVENPPGNYSPASTNPSILMHAIDFNTGEYFFGRNGVWTGDPVAGTGAVYVAVAGIVYPATWISFPGICTIRLRADEFDYAPPTGYSAWGPDIGAPLPDANEFGVDEDGNIVYDGVAPVPDSILPDLPTVKDALELVAIRAGLTADMYDFDNMDDETLQGFFVARESQGDAVITVLGQAYFFDVFEGDGKIRSVKRGGNSILTIDADDLVMREGPPVTEVREQEVERPRKLNLLYADPVMNYTPTKQTAERRATTVNAVGERTIDTPVVMGRDQAAQTVDKAMKVIWTDMLGNVTFDLPDALSYLTPTDPIILSYRGKNQRIRIDQASYDAGQFAVVSKQDRQGCYTSDVEGVGSPPPPVPSGLLGVTRFVFLNTYPLRDADDKFGFYVACTGVLPNWPGAIIEWTIDDGVTWNEGGNVLTKAIIGNLVDPLPAALAAVRDYSNTLRVYIGDRTVSSITAEQLLQEQNAAAIIAADGSVEIVQFQTATAEGNGVFALTTLARGRNGTESVLHAIDETFVMLSGAVFIETPVSLLGKQIKVRAVTRGTAAANNAEYDEDFTTAYIQTEHAPAHLIHYRVGSDVSLYWSGSGLFGTPANSFTGTKFGGYQLTFSDGATSVVKTSLGASYIYSSADQTTDFGAPVTVGNLDVEIRQVNTITGVGPALTETI